MDKIIFLDIGNQLSYRPRFKRGTGLILGGSMLAGVLGSVGSAAISSAGQNSVNNKQMDFALSENQKNRDWQSNEAQIARDWNRQEWDRQFQLQNEQWFTQLYAQNGIWRQQQDYLNRYNSPAEQVKRLQAAGLNPSLVLGDAGNAGGLAPAVSTNVNAPANVASPVASPIGNSSISLGNPSQYFAQSFMQSFQSFANGFKQLVTAGPEGQKLGAEAQKAVSEMFVNEREAEQLELKNFILSQTKDSRIKKVFSELEDVNAGIWLKKLNGELTQAEIDKVLQETMTGFAKEALMYAQTDQIRQAMYYYFDNLSAQWKYWSNLGSAAVTSASANVISASAYKDYVDSVKVLNSDVHVENLYNQMVKGIADNNPNYYGKWIQDSGTSIKVAREAYTSELFKQINLNRDLTPEQIQQARYATEQLRVAADYAEMNAALGAFSQAVGMSNASRLASAAEQNARAHNSSAAAYGRFVDGQLYRLDKVRNRRVTHYDADDNKVGSMIERIY